LFAKDSVLHGQNQLGRWISPQNPPSHGTALLFMSKVAKKKNIASVYRARRWDVDFGMKEEVDTNEGF
jgi:hypothetical protein